MAFPGRVGDLNIQQRQDLAPYSWPVVAPPEGLLECGSDAENGWLTAEMPCGAAHHLPALERRNRLRMPGLICSVCGFKPLPNAAESRTAESDAAWREQEVPHGKRRTAPKVILQGIHLDGIVFRKEVDATAERPGAAQPPPVDDGLSFFAREVGIKVTAADAMLMRGGFFFCIQIFQPNDDRPPT